MKSTKKSLLMSVLSLVLCFAMLLGTTYAWFTDSVTSGVNQIQAGNLDIEVYHSNAKVTEATSIEGVNAMFTDKNGNAILWEPGAMSYENFTVKNVGNLALKYNMSMNVVDFNKVAGTGDNLKDALKVKVLTGTNILSPVTREKVAALDWTGAQTLDQFKKDGGKLYPAGTYGQDSEEAFQVIVYWQPTDNDNDWNLQNGKTSTDGQPLFINFGVTVAATQLEYESDSFDNLYDASAQAPNVVMPSWSGESAAAALNSGSATTYAITQNTKIKASVTVPATATVTYENGNVVGTNDKFALVVEPGTNTSNGVTIGTGNSITTFDVSLENVITHEKVVSNEAMKVTLDVGFIDLVRFYHKGTEYTDKVNSTDDVTAVGKFYYDTTTGIVTFMTKDFSPFSAVYKFAGGLGTEDHPYLINSAKMYKDFLTINDGSYLDGYFALTADIDLGGADISNYNEYPRNFVFDGKNHVLSNFSGGVFGGNCYYYKGTSTDIEIKDLKVKDANADYALFGYGAYTACNITFDNVDVEDCVSSGGTYIFYGYKAASLTFRDCDVSNTKVTGGSSMAVGGFVGNCSSSHLVIDNCTFCGSVISKKDMVAGFVGQPGNGDPVITNSEIKSGTIIKNLANDGNVALFDGQGKNYATEGNNNKFNGTAVCDNQNKVTSNGFTGYAWEKYELVPINLKSADFEIAADGTITYKGDETIQHLTVYQQLSVDYFKNGIFSKDGYPWTMGPILKADNVTKDSTVGQIARLTSIRNVVDEIDKDSVAYSTTDTSVYGNADWADDYYGLYLHGSTMYLYAQRYSSGGQYVFSGTGSGQSRPTTKNVSVTCSATNDDGAVVGTVVLSYAIILA